MLHKRRDETEQHENSPSCTVWEYGSAGAIDGADALISGRYPEKGYSLNEISDVSVRIINGFGALATKQVVVGLGAGDVVFIPHGEAYFFTGTGLTLFMACSPAWSPDQYKAIE